MNMNNEQLNKKSKTSKINTRSVVYAAVMAALLAVLAPIAIPTGWGISFSLGTLAVYVISSIIDWKHGLVAMGVYLVLGVCCLPVFSGYMNLYQCIGGPTFGYVIGYIPCVFISGIMSDNIHKFKYIFYPFGMIIGTVCLYATGTAWFCFVTGSGFIAALALCVLPYLAFDAAKIAAATVIVCALKPKLNKHNNFKARRA